ncbi:MAG: MFS transporter [Oscillospiraceae bacterium]
MQPINYRHTILASYGGYITQAVVNNFIPLLFLIFQDEFEIPLEQITLLVTVNFIIQLAVDLASAKFVDRIGYRRALVGAHIFACAGIAGLAVLPNLLPPFAGLMTSVVLYAVGGGLTEVLISPLVEACPSDNKAGAMGLLHSFYCWGSVGTVLLSTLFLWGFGKSNWRILALLWALFPAAIAVVFTRVPIPKIAGESGGGMKLRELLKTKVFWVMAVLILCAGGSELAMSQWASAFAESALGVPKMVGDLLGPCFFAVLMGTSRVIYAKVSARTDIMKYMRWCGVLCIFSYMLAAFSPIPLLSLIGCGLCGFSVGCMWPGTYSLAAEALPRGGTALFAMLALAGDSGCSGGPTLVGLLSGAMNGGLKSGLPFAAVFPSVLVVLTFAAQKNSGRHSR